MYVGPIFCALKLGGVACVKSGPDSRPSGAAVLLPRYEGSSFKPHKGYTFEYGSAGTS